MLDPLNPFFFFNGSVPGPRNPFFARSGTETRKPSTEIKSKAIENELGSDSGDHYSSRHNGVHFFNISTSKSAANLVCFVHFDFETRFALQQRAF